MNKQLSFLAIVVLICAMVIVAPLHAGQDAEHLPSLAPAESATDQADTETGNGIILPPASPGPSLTVYEQAVREARKAGDTDRLNALLESAPVAAQPPGLETTGGSVITPSTSFGGSGDPRKDPTAESGDALPGLEAVFGTDVQVRPGSNSWKEWNQCMASDSNGNVYVAWQDDYHSSGDYIQIYRSSDNGKTWSAYGYVLNNSADLIEPSIAVGQGNNGDTLVLAYIVVDGTNIPHPEVATTPLGQNSFTIHSLPYYSFWEGYSRPSLWTDSFDYSNWYAYLTCQATYDASSDNHNVVFYRSTDGGQTWAYPNTPSDGVLLGDTDAYAWEDPDGTYGTMLDRVFVACYRDDTDTLYAFFSDDFGATWDETNDLKVIGTTAGDPSHSTATTNPDIEAGPGHNNVMIVSAGSQYDANDIGQTYSTDAGETWPRPLWSMEGDTDTNEFEPELTSNEGGNSWHVAYTSADWWVRYSQRPQDLSNYWQATPDVVNDTDYASAEYPKKGIASNWTSDVPTVAWSDYRDGNGDYDTYADTPGGSSGEPIIRIEPETLDFVE
jgi:hypothetical protein